MAEFKLSNVVENLIGSNGKERYQLWPERILRSAVELPHDVMTGQTPIVDPATGRTSEKVIERAQDMTAMMGGSTIPSIAAKGVAKDALGIVPVARAKELKFETGKPNEILKSAVENTPGASIDADGHLVVAITRNQRPEQELSSSVRGGVFYLPKGDANAKFYSGTNENFAYGGTQKIQGETAFKNPLVVKGATGGKAPEAAYSQLMGKDKFKELNDDVSRSVGAYYLSKSDKKELVRQFLQKHAPEMEDYAYHILENSSKGNQLRYALQEAAIASAARKAGHDGIVGYSELRGANKGKQKISEVYDVREDSYPSPHGDYSIHQDLLASGVPVNHDPFKTTPVDYSPDFL